LMFLAFAQTTSPEEAGCKRLQPPSPGVPNGSYSSRC
ncbi:hypothetical protein NPIL_16231, partial [Nephila pilipes]